MGQTITKAEAARQEREQAIAVLRKDFPQGSTVHTVIRHVSASGMSRSISVLTVDEDGTIYDVSGMVARAVGRKFDTNHGGVKCNGAGMDMTFELAYTLAQNLYGAQNGYALNHRNI